MGHYHYQYAKFESNSSSAISVIVFTPFIWQALDSSRVQMSAGNFDMKPSYPLILQIQMFVVVMSIFIAGFMQLYCMNPAINVDMTTTKQRTTKRVHISWNILYFTLVTYPDHSLSPQASYPAPHSWRDHPYDPSGPCHGWLLAD